MRHFFEGSAYSDCKYLQRYPIIEKNLTTRHIHPDTCDSNRSIPTPCYKYHSIASNLCDGATETRDAISISPRHFTIFHSLRSCVATPVRDSQQTFPPLQHPEPSGETLVRMKEMNFLKEALKHMFEILHTGDKMPNYYERM